MGGRARRRLSETPVGDKPEPCLLCVSDHVSNFHASQPRAEVKHASGHRQLRRYPSLTPPAFSRIPAHPKRRTNSSTSQQQLPSWMLGVGCWMLDVPRLLLTLALLLLPLCAAAAEPTVPDDVRAAELMESALYARNAGPEELKKMEQ